MWWTPAQPSVRRVRHIAGLSTLPCLLRRLIDRRFAPASPTLPGLFYTATMPFQLSHEAERRWVLVLIQIEVNRNHERHQAKDPQEGGAG